VNQSDDCRGHSSFKGAPLPLCVPSVLLTVLLLSGDIPTYGLVIKPVFDSSIANDPKAASIMNTINSAIAVYEASFSDPITVTINFQETSSGLGASSTYFTTKSYSSYLSHLASDSSTASDSTALAHLPGGFSNPVNGNRSVTLSTANARAIGYNSNPPFGEPDGYVYLNTSIINPDRLSINPNKYDLFAVVSHEIDEVLGFDSALNGLSNGSSNPGGAVSSLDLFRYDQNGNRSLSTSSSAQAYFSIDGTSRLAQFNQDDGGDFSDWYSLGFHTPRVQDAFGTPGAIPTLGVELIGLDVIGYNLVPPALTMSPAGSGQMTIAWPTDVPGFILQESTGNTPFSWENSASGSDNPATISTTGTAKFYRLYHP